MAWVNITWRDLHAGIVSLNLSYWWPARETTLSHHPPSTPYEPTGTTSAYRDVNAARLYEKTGLAYTYSKFQPRLENVAMDGVLSSRLSAPCSPEAALTMSAPSFTGHCPPASPFLLALPPLPSWLCTLSDSSSSFLPTYRQETLHLTCCFISDSCVFWDLRMSRENVHFEFACLLGEFLA